MNVRIFGADWCKDTRRSLKLLDSLGVAYEYVNIQDDDAASQWVKEQNDGKEIKPTILLGDRVLAAPADRELENAVRESQVAK